jgi:hypothetical protein
LSVQNCTLSEIFLPASLDECIHGLTRESGNGTFTKAIPDHVPSNNGGAWPGPIYLLDFALTVDAAYQSRVNS